MVSRRQYAARPPWKLVLGFAAVVSVGAACVRGPIAMGPGVAGPVSIMRLRAYVDQDYRRADLGYVHRIRTSVAAASDVITSHFGVRLVLRDVRPWDRQAHRDDEDAVLEELTALDPGGDVDWVVGFVAREESMDGPMHSAGVARTLSRHFVVRSPDDPKVREALVTSPVLTRADGMAIYEERRYHREVAVLLHEWGHTLGAIHAVEPQWIMSPKYSRHVRSLAPANVRLIEVALQHRLRGGEPTSMALCSALRHRLQSEPWSGWVGRDRARFSKYLRRRCPGPPSPLPP
jgi:hypothetical protein